MPVQVLKTNEVRERWREVVDAAQAGHTDTVINRHGKPVAVLIPHADYVALQDELQDLREARLALAELHAWRDDPSTGRPYTEIRQALVTQGLLDD